MMISDIYGANELYDGHIMKKMRVYQVMDPNVDCIIYDHHFDSEALNFIESDHCQALGFSEKNICPNIMKKRNTTLADDQIEYQQQHGAFRSTQESEKKLN